MVVTKVEFFRHKRLSSCVGGPIVDCRSSFHGGTAINGERGHFGQDTFIANRRSGRRYMY